MCIRVGTSIIKLGHSVAGAMVNNLWEDVDISKCFESRVVMLYMYDVRKTISEK